MNLIEVLKQVPDHRHARGKRHPLWVLLVMMVMGNLAGYHGNRPLERFAQRYGWQIGQLLKIELAGLPSFSTFRRTYQELDFTALSHLFSQWMSGHLRADEDSYAIDGKRIKQPIVGEDGKTRFVGLVSAFGQSQGVTVALAALSETENSEIKVVQCLIEKLQLQGVVLTLDALHTPKNT